MKRGGKMLACMMGGLAVCTAANAVTTEDSSANPYQSIIDRNVFSLKPPPPPPDPSENTKPTVLKITLTGITTILGNKRVLMKTAPPPGKPGETPKTEQYYILTEGQREGDIEVISIDEKAGSVKVKNAGADQTLTFEKDGAKLPATQPPAAPGAVPGAPGAMPPVPGLPGTRPTPNAPAGATPTFQLPTRIPRLPTTGNQSASLAPGAAGSAGGIAPGYGTPGFLPGNTTTPIAQNPTQAATPVSQLSPEEQAIMIEANRQRGGIGSSLLPPTVLSPKVNEAAPTPAQNAQNPAAFIPPIPGRPPGPY